MPAVLLVNSIQTKPAGNCACGRYPTFKIIHHQDAQLLLPRLLCSMQPRPTLQPGTAGTAAASSLHHHGCGSVPLSTPVWPWALTHCYNNHTALCDWDCLDGTRGTGTAVLTPALLLISDVEVRPVTCSMCLSILENSTVLNL